MRPMLSLAWLLIPAAGLLAAPPKAKPLFPALDLAGMDRQVAPGDDFFAHANGGWLARTQVPSDRGSYGVWDVMGDLTDRRVADLIRSAARAKAPAGSDLRKIGDCFAAFMDAPAIERRGLSPLKAALATIEAVQDRAALARVLGAGLEADVDVLNATQTHTPNLLGLWVAADLDEPTRYRPFLLQGGLAMPDRSYYLEADGGMPEIRAKYRTYVTAMLAQAGLSDPGARADRVIALETRMARAHWSRQDSGDVKKGNNPWTRADFDVKAPGLDWSAFLGAAGLAGEGTFTVWQPSAVAGLSALAASEPLEAWKDYLVFHTLHRWAPVLPKAVFEPWFAFNGTVLTGAEHPRPRWQQAVAAVNGALGEIVGRAYVKRYFPPEAKARAKAMVGEIVQAFRQRIDQLSWMAPETKAMAKAKLDVLKVGVGYPDRWPDFSGLAIDPSDAFGNAQRAARFRTRQQLAKLGRPVDRDEWVMTPQTINAVNLPVLNAMNFPAAILQPPFFDPARPLAMDYGATGATIGHEISHSFDDQGALFDAQGRLRNWWTPEDLRHFEAVSDQLVRQFNAYRPFSDLPVNGKQTLGENIADVAGLAAAYDAYRAALQGRPAPLYRGLTGDQQFFLSYAQSWRDKALEPTLRQQVLTDGHAPGIYRAFTVRNLDAWYAAFGVKPGQKLFLAPGDRVRIW